MLMHTPTEKEWINVVENSVRVWLEDIKRTRVQVVIIYTKTGVGVKLYVLNGKGEECVIFRSVRYKKKSNLPPFRKCTVLYTYSIGPWAHVMLYNRFAFVFIQSAPIYTHIMYLQCMLAVNGACILDFLWRVENFPIMRFFRVRQTWLKDFSCV